MLARTEAPVGLFIATYEDTTNGSNVSFFLQSTVYVFSQLTVEQMVEVSVNRVIALRLSTPIGRILGNGGTFSPLITIPGSSQDGHTNILNKFEVEVCGEVTYVADAASVSVTIEAFTKQFQVPVTVGIQLNLDLPVAGSVLKVTSFNVATPQAVEQVKSVGHVAQS
jgi:hypothetical protein